MKTITKKKKIKEVPATVETPVIPEEIEEVVSSITSTLPIIEGSQAIDIIDENETSIHYRLANGTTTWVPKK